ncbi:hypothetical protein OAG63_00705 [Methylacidiphilales bacterium]|nr:hypothetical protein [Candidatus Methylacidiphilales bacterium]
MKDQSFTHRPPTTGIHLLSDPLPKRTTSLDVEEQRRNLVLSKIAAARNKKSGLRS